MSRLSLNTEYEASLYKDMLKLAREALKECKEIQQFVIDEREVEMQLTKEIKKNYAKDMQFLVETMLGDSEVRNNGITL